MVSLDELTLMASLLLLVSIWILLTNRVEVVAVGLVASFVVSLGPRSISSILCIYMIRLSRSLSLVVLRFGRCCLPWLGLLHHRNDLFIIKQVIRLVCKQTFLILHELIKLVVLVEDVIESISFIGSHV